MHITETVRVAALAWNKVKPADDPDFNRCALSHRETLIAKVEAIERTGSASDDFEVAAKEILDSMLKAPEPTPTTEASAQAEGKPAKASRAKKSR